MKKIGTFLLIFCFVGLSAETYAVKYNIKENIHYWNSEDTAFDPINHMLDVYYPRDHSKPKEVMVFIHGGRWESGDKSLYAFIGRNIAKKGKIGVVINYRLAPKVKYDDMALDCATAVRWVKNNIRRFGGDPDKIYVSGHSAGGHLAAYMIFNGTFEKRLKMQDPIKGCVLIDAFGLDMYSYLNTYKTPTDLLFYQTFTDDPKNWKKGSPMYSLYHTNVNFMVFAGSKTYLPILEDSKAITQKLSACGNKVQYEIIEGKKHVGMIVQMYWGWNQMYKKIIPFMENYESPDDLGQLTLTDTKKD